MPAANSRSSYQRLSRRPGRAMPFRQVAATPQGRWKVFGEDRDGDELVCVVAIEAGVVVVTVF